MVTAALSTSFSQDAQTSDYSSWSRPLTSLLEGCVVSWPSKLGGRGRLEWAPDRRAVAERLQGIPGVTFQPHDAPPHEADIFIPHNLFVMGQRPASLEQYTPDPQETTPSGLKLKDYQRRSVSFLRACTKESQGVLLGSDPGLGKTVTALQALWLDGYLHRPGLVIGPLGAQGVWCGPNSDAHRHYGLDILPLEGTAVDPSVLKRSQWFFIHYDVLPAWQSWLFSQLRAASIVVDECHSVMNSDGKRFKAVLTAVSFITTERRYGLTGTPIPKDRFDLYGQLAVLQPGQWGFNKYPYGLRYLGGHKSSHHEGGHWVFEDQTNTDELKARLAGVYLRVPKMDVATDLPKLHRHRVDVTLPDAEEREYRSARYSIVKWMEAHGKREAPEKLMLGSVEVTIKKEEMQAKQLVTTSVLRSILDRGKLQHALKVISEIMVKHKRLVVFTWKRDSAKLLVEQLAALHRQRGQGPAVFGPVDGTDSWAKRRELAAQFAASPWGVFVATRGAVGIAINDLSAADACIQVTPDWNPDGNLQAESRLHREGASAPEVHSYYMLCRGTLDDRVMELLNQKSYAAKSIAPLDRAGMNLVNDLDPSCGDAGWSIEELATLLKEIEEF